MISVICWSWILLFWIISVDAIPANRQISAQRQLSTGSIIQCSDLPVNLQQIEPICSNDGLGKQFRYISNVNDTGEDMAESIETISSDLTIAQFLQESDIGENLPPANSDFPTPPTFPMPVDIIQNKFTMVRIFWNPINGIVTKISLYVNLFKDQERLNIGDLKIKGTVDAFINLDYIDDAILQSDWNRLRLDITISTLWQFRVLSLPIELSTEDSFRRWSFIASLESLTLRDVLIEFNAVDFLNNQAFQILPKLADIGLRKININTTWATDRSSFLFRFAGSPVFFDLEPFSNGLQVLVGRSSDSNLFQSVAIAFNAEALPELFMNILDVSIKDNTTIFSYLPTFKPALYLSSSDVSSSDAFKSGFNLLSLPRLGPNWRIYEGATLAMEISRPNCMDNLPIGDSQLCNLLTKIFTVNNVIDRVLLSATTTTNQRIILRAEIGFLHLGIENAEFALLLEYLGLEVDASPISGVAATVYGTVSLRVGDDQSLAFDSSIGISSLGDLILRLQMRGIWYNAFGIPKFSVGNLMVGVKLNVQTMTVPAFAFGGEVWIGNPEECQQMMLLERSTQFNKRNQKVQLLGKSNDARLTTALEPLCIKSIGYVGVDFTNPLNNWFYGKLTGVTLGLIVRLFLNMEESTIPSIWAATGFPDGFEISFSWLSQALPDGRLIPAGVQFSGGVNFLNQIHLNAFVIVGPIDKVFQNIFVNITTYAMTFGVNKAVALYRDPETTVYGPNFLLDTSLSTVSLPSFFTKAQGYLRIFNIISQQAEIEISDGIFNVYSSSAIMNFISANVSVYANVLGIETDFFLLNGKVNLDFIPFQEMFLAPIANKVITFLRKADNALTTISDKLQEHINKVEEKKREVCDSINNACSRLPPMCNNPVFRWACRAIKWVIDTSCMVACRVASGVLTLYQGLVRVAQGLVDFTRLIANGAIKMIDFMLRYPLLRMFRMLVSALVGDRFRRGYVNVTIGGEVLNLKDLSYISFDLPLIEINTNNVASTASTVAPKVLEGSIGSMSTEEREQVLPLLVSGETSAPVILTFPSDASIECSNTTITELKQIAADTIGQNQVEIDSDCPQQGIQSMVYVDTINGTMCREYVERNWTITDHCGKTTYQVQKIRIQDTIGPTFPYNPPEDVVRMCSATTTAAVAVAEAPNIIAVDACYNDPWPRIDEQVRPISSNFPEGCVSKRMLRTWTAYDICDNQGETYQQMVTLLDEKPPEFTTTAVNLTLSFLDWWLGIAIPDQEADDECGSTVKMMFDESSSDVSEQPCNSCLTLVRTWHAVDACLNEAQQDQQLTVMFTDEPLRPVIEMFPRLSVIALNALSANGLTLPCQLVAGKTMTLNAVNLLASDSCRTLDYSFVSGGNAMVNAGSFYQTIGVFGMLQIAGVQNPPKIDTQPEVNIDTIQQSLTDFEKQLLVLPADAINDRVDTDDGTKWTWTASKPMYTILNVTDKIWKDERPIEITVTGTTFQQPYLLVFSVQSEEANIKRNITIFQRKTQNDLPLDVMFYFPNAKTLKCQSVSPVEVPVRLTSYKTLVSEEWRTVPVGLVAPRADVAFQCPFGGAQMIFHDLHWSKLEGSQESSSTCTFVADNKLLVL